MGCTFNNSVVHGGINKSNDETGYFCLHQSCLPCPPSCRCEFVGSSGCCSSGKGVWDVCDCAQEGQLEVSLISLFSSVFYCVAFFSVYLPAVPIFSSSLHLCLCSFCFFVFLCLFFFVFLPTSGFSGLFVWLRGETFTVWHGFRMHSKEWVIIIYGV